MSMRGRGTPVVAGLPQADGASGLPNIKNAGVAPGSNVQLITLNTECEWLLLIKMRHVELIIQHYMIANSQPHSVNEPMCAYD